MTKAKSQALLSIDKMGKRGKAATAGGTAVEEAKGLHVSQLWRYRSSARPVDLLRLARLAVLSS